MKGYIVTRKDEKIKTTSNPLEMLDNFLAEDLLRGWAEDFVDKTSGEVVPVERHELIAEKGTFIDADQLAKINFHIQAGDISCVRISSQQRKGKIYKCEHNRLYSSIVDVDGKSKKFLFYANSVKSGFEVLSDFLELNYEGHCDINRITEIGCSVLLEDFKQIRECEIDGTTSALGFFYIEVEETYDSIPDKWSFFVRSIGIEHAVELIEQYLIKTAHEDCDENLFSCKLILAKKIACSGFIDIEFTNVNNE
jgi:hypothetical protein